MARGSKHGLDRAEWRVRAREFCRRGSELPHAKLTADTVREIRANRRGWTARQWSAHLGVHVRTVEAIRAYRTWVHV